MSLIQNLLANANAGLFFPCKAVCKFSQSLIGVYITSTVPNLRQIEASEADILASKLPFDTDGSTPCWKLKLTDTARMWSVRAFLCDRFAQFPYGKNWQAFCPNVNILLRFLMTNVS